jgi:hypothetical protein
LAPRVRAKIKGIVQPQVIKNGRENIAVATKHGRRFGQRTNQGDGAIGGTLGEAFIDVEVNAQRSAQGSNRFDAAFVRAGANLGNPHLAEQLNEIGRLVPTLGCQRAEHIIGARPTCTGASLGMANQKQRHEIFARFSAVFRSVARLNEPV